MLVHLEILENMLYLHDDRLTGPDELVDAFRNACPKSLNRPERRMQLLLFK